MDTQRRKQYSKYRSNYRARQEDTEKDIRETILLQCTVSGIILLTTLVVSLINFPFSAELRHNLKQAISQETSPENIRDFISGITGQVDGVQNSVKALFEGNGERINRENVDIDSAPEEGEIPTIAIEPHANPEANPTDNLEVNPTDNLEVNPTADPSAEVRIDEDILQQLQDNAQDLEAGGKKAVAPSEGVTAELH